jgi:hypothetical protein
MNSPFVELRESDLATVGLSLPYRFTHPHQYHRWQRTSQNENGGTFLTHEGARANLQEDTLPGWTQVASRSCWCITCFDKVAIGDSADRSRSVTAVNGEYSD